jgi:hypothetical protein
MALSQPVTQIVCSITYILTKSNWINACSLAKLVKKLLKLSQADYQAIRRG